LDDADASAVALVVGAEPAGIDGGDGVADRAVKELLFYLDDGLGQRPGLVGAHFQEVVGEAGRRLGTDARQTGELADEPGERIGHRRETAGGQNRPGRLAAIAPIRPCIVSPIFRTASLTAATTRSSSIEGSSRSITSGSILTATSW